MGKNLTQALGYGHAFNNLLSYSSADHGYINTSMTLFHFSVYKLVFEDLISKPYLKSET